MQLPNQKDTISKRSDTTIFTVMSKLAQEHEAINLGQGFPDFETDPELLQLVEKYVRAGKNQYCPLAGLPALLEVIAQKINHIYGKKLDPGSEICITAGATQALHVAIMSIVGPGDEVVIIEPAYDSYKPQIELAGGVAVPYSLTYPDYTVDWDELRELITSRTRMIIINTPHNPTGTILKSDDLKQLERLVKGTGIVVLSDEVYEHIIFDGEEHQSVLRYPTLYEQSMAVFSFGKTLHATGWKLGYIVGPEKLISAFKAIHQWNVFCVNSFLQYAIADYLVDPSRYQGLSGFFQEKRDYMNRHFKELPLQSIESKGTYFQLYNYEGLSELDDFEFSKYLTAEIGVAAIPLSPFYSNPPGDKVVRLCFAKREETIEKAADRLQSLVSIGH